MNHREGTLSDCAEFFWTRVLDRGLLTVSNLLAWRNCVVVSTPTVFSMPFGYSLFPVYLRAKRSLIVSFIVGFL